MDYVPLAARRLEANHQLAQLRQGRPIGSLPATSRPLLHPRASISFASTFNRKAPAAPPDRRPRYNPAVSFLAAPATKTTLLLEDLREATRASRGTDVSSQRAALRHHLGGLGVLKLASEMRDASVRGKFTRNRRSGMSQYALCMEVKRSSCFPITKDKVASYLAWSLLEKDTVQSHTLGKVLGNLRGAAQLMNEWHLSRGDEDELKGHIRLLQQAKPSSTRITMPIPTANLIATATRLQGLDTLLAKQALGLLTVGLGTLARGTEMGSKRGMRWGDLVTDQRGIGLNAFYGKLSHGSSAPRPRAFPHLPVHLSSLCPARALNAYRAALQSAGGLTGPLDCVWVKIDESGSPTILPLSVTQTTAIVRAELAADGADVSGFGDHWGRYAGNNVLSYDLRMHGVADMLGDWAPPGPTGIRMNVRRRVYSHPTLDKQMTLAHDEARAIHGLSLCCQL